MTPKNLYSLIQIENICYNKIYKRRNFLYQCHRLDFFRLCNKGMQATKISKALANVKSI